MNYFRTPAAFSDAGTLPRRLLVVDIAAMKASAVGDEVLATYSLGSCIGMALFDPDLRTGALMHCLLPFSNSNPARAAAEPYRFVDSGAAALLRLMFEQGSRRQRLRAWLAGGGSPCAEDRFRVGEKNLRVARRFLEKNAVTISGECVGGSDPKTMYLQIHEGRTLVRTPEGVFEL